MTEKKRAIHLFFGQKILFSNNNIYFQKNMSYESQEYEFANQ